ncbi:MAG: RdgB/HAM1 family non-canonical purine NTP pyrophosphatase [Halothiobacillaceae bacterium]|nr:RdgB/HAM1 family non-canonical purine NTP pyrophosphatase [Halothiobacillaceae bacterium]HER35470.1 RdgB/HAM1 family non-canonical purine NTP pyrophosphatase [Halothiobacillaceae bacterium]
MIDIVIATNNDGKMAEFEQMRRVLADGHPSLVRLRFVSQRQWAVASPAEDADTFRDNALIKARHTAAETGRPAIGDDSGLVVDALDGRPGIFSSRFAGEKASDADNNAKLVEELAKQPAAPRTARFVCALAFVRHAEDPEPIVVEGNWDGEVLDAPRGERGFGYDPLFFSPEHGLSVGEMDPDEKHRVSHRARALEQLIDRLADLELD